MTAIVKGSVWTRIGFCIWEVVSQRVSERSETLTAPSIVIHKENPVQNGSEWSDIGDRIAIRTEKGHCLRGSSDAGGGRERGTEEAEEGEKVGGVVWGVDVSCTGLGGVFPVDVDAIEVEAGIEFDDVLYKGLPGLGRGDD
jgi:hypothetical protein